MSRASARLVPSAKKYEKCGAKSLFSRASCRRHEATVPGSACRTFERRLVQRAKRSRDAHATHRQLCRPRGRTLFCGDRHRALPLAALQALPLDTRAPRTPRARMDSRDVASALPRGARRGRRHPASRQPIWHQAPTCSRRPRRRKRCCHDRGGGGSVRRIVRAAWHGPRARRF